MEMNNFPAPAKEHPETLGRIWKWFLSATCPGCGGKKIPKQCFDKSCYFMLDERRRSGLYVSALEGLEFYENYYKALLRLREMGVK